MLLSVDHVLPGALLGSVVKSGHLYLYLVHLVIDNYAVQVCSFFSYP